MFKLWVKYLITVNIDGKMRMNGASILLIPGFHFDTYRIRILEWLINLCLFEENVPVGYPPEHLLESRDPCCGDYAGYETEMSVHCVVVLLQRCINKSISSYFLLHNSQLFLERKYI